MAIANFDQLNNLGYQLVPLEDVPEESRRSEPYDEYFGDMYQTEEELDNRMNTARQMEEPVRDYLTMLLILTLMNEQQNYIARDEFVQTLSENGIGDEEYRFNLADDLYDSTMRHADDLWYWSEDRVLFISENEANTIEGAKEFALAKMRGMSRKQWKGMGDRRERRTHTELNDVILPIDEYFNIGHARGLYPKDVMSPQSTLPSHPEEVINCRCSVLYLK